MGAWARRTVARVRASFLANDDDASAAGQKAPKKAKGDAKKSAAKKSPTSASKASKTSAASAKADIFGDSDDEPPLEDHSEEVIEADDDDDEDEDVSANRILKSTAKRMKLKA